MMSLKSPWVLGALALGAYWYFGKKKTSSADSAPAALPSSATASKPSEAEVALRAGAGSAVNWAIDLAKEQAGIKGMGGVGSLAHAMNGLGAYGDLGGSFYNAWAT